MSNSGFVFSKKAVEDISSIWNYTFDSWSKEKANSYYNDIVKHCYLIGKNPSIGRKYEGVIESLRGIKTNRHIIFYRQLETGMVEVVRILHDRMDLKRHLEK